MKMKGIALALCLFCVLSVNAATIKGNGNVITKEISISDFDIIETGGNISFDSKGLSFKKKDGHTLNYSQQNGKSTLSITIDENLFPYLDIQSSNRKLSIKSTNRDKLHPTKFTIKASSKDLQKISLSGSMNFIVETPLKSDYLAISVSGAGDVILDKRADINSMVITISGAGDVKASNLYCKEFESKVSGAGDINLKGEAENARFSVSGAGDVSAYEFKAEDVSASVSGAGDVKVYANRTLDASVSGIGDISYKGNPEVKSKKSGMGSIRKR